MTLTTQVKCLPYAIKYKKEHEKAIPGSETPKRWRDKELKTCHRKINDKDGKCHPKALAPANDQLQSRPATVYEDEVKM